MANLNLVSDSCLSERVRKRRRLIEQVRNVALDIEFADDGDRRILARELDARGILPIGTTRWFHRERNNHCKALERFLQIYLPELLRKRPGRAR